MIDTVALGVAFSWDKEGQPITSVIFDRNSPLPSVKLLTFYRCACRCIVMPANKSQASLTADTGIVGGFPARQSSRSVMCMDVVRSSGRFVWVDAPVPCVLLSAS